MWNVCWAKNGSLLKKCNLKLLEGGLHRKKSEVEVTKAWNTLPASPPPLMRDSIEVALFNICWSTRTHSVESFLLLGIVWNATSGLETRAVFGIWKSTIYEFGVTAFNSQDSTAKFSLTCNNLFEIYSDIIEIFFLEDRLKVVCVQD